jgi:hypothetical protein
MAIIYMDYIFKFAIRITRRWPTINGFLKDKFEDVSGGKFVAFVHHSNRLFKILNYIERNETGWNIKLVVCRSHDARDPKKNYTEIKELLPTLEKAGVFPHLNVTVDYRDEEFGPNVINKVEKEYKIRRNRIMIGSIHAHHPYNYQDLGGVRIIF